MSGPQLDFDDGSGHPDTREKKPPVAIDIDNVQRVLRVLDRAKPLIAELEVIFACRPGRKKEWSVRGTLALFILIARWHPEGFRTGGAFEALRIPTDVLIRIGLTKPNGELITDRQVRYALKQYSEFIDPYRPGLPDTERDARQAVCHRITTELLIATLPRELRRKCGKHLAVDGTLMWAWGRPADHGDDKLEASDAPQKPIDDPIPYDPETYVHEEARSARWPEVPDPGVTATGKRKRRPFGSVWVGNSDPKKRVHGVQHHVTTVTPGPTSDDIPMVATGLFTTPAAGNAVAAGLETLRAIIPILEQGSFQRVENIAADAAYTSREFMLTLRGDGINGVARLHRTNQEGHHGSLKDGSIIIIDGEPYSPCLPAELRDLQYPYKAWEKGNAEKLQPYWEMQALREQYAYKQRGKTPHHGKYTFFSPFNGDCPQCGHLPPAQQCCSAKRVTIAVEDLPLHQDTKFGTPEWDINYASRSRIEGVFSLLKTGNIVSYCRNFARFTDFGKITLATLFALIAVNMDRVDDWYRRQRLRDAGHDDGRAPRNVRPRFKDICKAVSARTAPPVHTPPADAPGSAEREGPPERPRATGRSKRGSRTRPRR